MPGVLYRRTGGPWSKTVTDGCVLPNGIIWYEKDGRGESKTVKNGWSVQRILGQTCYGRTGAPIGLLDCLEFYVLCVNLILFLCVNLIFFLCVNLILEFSILGVLSTLFVFFVSYESFVCSFDQRSLRSRQPNSVVRAKLALVQTFLKTEQTHLF